eukprot:1015412-Prymnesium_polylepis.1
MNAQRVIFFSPPSSVRLNAQSRTAALCRSDLSRDGTLNFGAKGRAEASPAAQGSLSPQSGGSMSSSSAALGGEAALSRIPRRKRGNAGKRPPRPAARCRAPPMPPPSVVASTTRHHRRQGCWYALAPA